MKTTTTGLSLPIDLFVRIEAERGDVSRSRYLLRLLEKALEENNVQNQNQNNKVGGLSPSSSEPTEDDDVAATQTPTESKQELNEDV